MKSWLGVICSALITCLKLLWDATHVDVTVSCDIQYTRTNEHIVQFCLWCSYLMHLNKSNHWRNQYEALLFLRLSQQCFFFHGSLNCWLMKYRTIVTSQAKNQWKNQSSVAFSSVVPAMFLLARQPELLIYLNNHQRACSTPHCCLHRMTFHT